MNSKLLYLVTSRKEWPYRIIKYLYIYKNFHQPYSVTYRSLILLSVKEFLIYSEIVIYKPHSSKSLLYMEYVMNPYQQGNFIYKQGTSKQTDFQ